MGISCGLFSTTHCPPHSLPNGKGAVAAPGYNCWIPNHTTVALFELTHVCISCRIIIFTYISGTRPGMSTHMKCLVRRIQYSRVKMCQGIEESQLYVGVKQKRDFSGKIGK